MLITHDMGVIAETADRVAVMYAGRFVEIGEALRSFKMQNILHLRTDGFDSNHWGHRRGFAAIQGSMPRLAEIPEGCAFNPRCPNVKTAEKEST